MRQHLRGGVLIRDRIAGVKQKTSQHNERPDDQKRDRCDLAQHEFDSDGVGAAASQRSRVQSVKPASATTDTARTGTPWEGRSKVCQVEDGGYLLRCHRYLELDPLRFAMIGDPGDYPWSSHPSNTYAEDGTLVSRTPGICRRPATRRHVTGPTARAITRTSWTPSARMCNASMPMKPGAAQAHFSRSGLGRC